MNTIKATVRNGRLELDRPIDLPDGTELLIPLPEDPKDDAPMSPEEIERVLAAMEGMIPFDYTPEEEAFLEADRQSRKAWEIEHAEQRSQKLMGLWP